MTIADLPWLDLALLTPLMGAFIVARVRNPHTAFLTGVAATGLALVASLTAAAAYFLTPGRPDLPARMTDTPIFALDELNAPLLPLAALLHFLTALATPRTKMRRFSIAWSLASEAIRLAIFACRAPWPLITLLILCVITPVYELRNRGQSTRGYALHMGLFAILLVIGWAGLNAAEGGPPSVAASIALMVAALIRCGVVPAHTWLTDWIERASFGSALLIVTPLTGVYAAVRLVLPVAPDWVFSWISLLSLITAVYAAGMALVQSDARRFFAYFFLSHASIVLIGLELHTTASLTGSLFLWMAVAVSLCGFGLMLRAVEARIGPVSLTRYLGLYPQAPSLAVAFLVTGLACVGFPGTVGFVATELLVDGAVVADPVVGLGVVVATLLNGISVIRVYFLVFTGASHAAAVPLHLGPRERAAVLTIIALVIGGGLWPMPGLASRDRAARRVLENRPGSVIVTPPAAHGP